MKIDTSFNEEVMFVLIMVEKNFCSFQVDVAITSKRTLP